MQVPGPGASAGTTLPAPRYWSHRWCSMALAAGQCTAPLRTPHTPADLHRSAFFSLEKYNALTNIPANYCSNEHYNHLKLDTVTLKSSTAARLRDLSQNMLTLCKFHSAAPYMQITCTLHQASTSALSALISRASSSCKEIVFPDAQNRARQNWVLRART